MSQATHRRFSPVRLLTLLVANLVWFVPVLLVSAASVSAAQTITVTTATDDPTTATATTCATTPAACSLRDAILAGNAAPGSTVDLSGLGNATIVLGAALPSITANMTISGNGDAGLVTVSGANTYAAFNTATGTGATTVKFYGFTIANTAGGYVAGYGSGLFVALPATPGTIEVDITNMVFSHNVATSNGGAIVTDATAANTIKLVILGSTFTGNSAPSAGGAIWNGGDLFVDQSTFSGNYAGTQGSAINNEAIGFFGNVHVSDSTFVNNSAPGGNGGAIYTDGGILGVFNSTFSGNLPTTGGSIAYGSTDANTTLNNNVFVEPATPGTGQCTPNVNTGDLTAKCPVYPTSSGNATGNLDDTSANLKLGTLSYNGGATQTLLPQSGSPVLCGAVKSLALTSGGAGLTYDQRGNPPAFVGYPLDACTDTTKVDAGSVQVGGGTITVTTLTDDSGTAAGNAANCPGANCSLRDAIAAANASANPSTIKFSVTGTITLGAELPLTSGNITINGPGAGSLTLSGQGKYRILENYAGSLTVYGVTFDSGNSATQGGAFINAAVGSLDHVAFTNNTATSGGAIYSIRSLTITNSTFTGNSVGTGNGGAIDSTGALSVSNSTFNNNTAGQGAGIYDESDSSLPITYSTFANNTNSLAGTIVTNSLSVMSIANSTFSGNTAAAEDQDIYHNGGSLTVTNTIIGDAKGCGTTPDPACSTANGNVVAGAGLSVLGNYGGPTYTMLPLPGSSAICGGLLAKIPSGFSTDQRGFSNGVPAAYGCAGTSSDAGAVQTNYTAVAFNAGSYTASQAVAGATPQVIVSVTENAQNIGGIPLTLTTGGTAGTATGTTATTVGGTGATFSALTFPNIGTGTVAESLTVVGTDTLTAGPFNVVVSAGGTTAVTVSEAAPTPASFVVGANTTETLKATVTGTPTVNEGYVSFTVHQHTAAGAVIGTPVTGVPVAAGTTASVPYTISLPQTADTYYVVATYTDPGGTYQSNISDSTKFFTIAPAVTATQSIASKVLTVNQAAVNFTPVTGSGGVAPLGYSVAPALPGGLTMSTTTGAITGTPTAAIAATVFTVTVKDANNNTATNTFTLTINAAVTATTAIPTETLTQGVTPTPFTPVTGGGGTVPLGYSIVPGLPAGLTMAAGTGQISGTPTAALATTTFTVTVTDANLATATATFSLTVNGPLVATTAVPTTTLTAGQLATPFTPVTTTGGTAPLAFSVAPALPGGLAMSTTTGQITGTPAAASATGTYTVTVKDANNATQTATFSLTVSAAVTATTVVPSTTLTAGIAATAFTPVTGAGGTGALTYSVAPGLPGGLAMSATTGQITGTPAAASALTTYTVTVKDTNNATKTATFTLTVNAAVTATTAVPTTSLTAGIAATAFTPVTGAGGTGALAYSVAPGLPGGLTMSATTGQITGTPAAASATATYTVTVKDTNNATATATFSLTVNAALVATTAVPTTTLTAGHAATAFTPVTTTGGTAPLTFSVLPALPGGLTMASGTGTITGTPAAASTTATYTVTVKDANNATQTATFSLTVSAAVTATTAVSATTLTAGVAATAFTPVTGAGGTGALTYSVSPALPGALVISATTGQITGTPAAASALTTYTVTVKDTNNATATATFTLTVSAALTATSAVPTTVLTMNHAAAPFTPVTATGGTTPLAFSVAPTLPAGLAFSTTNGQVTGTPTAASAATNYTVTVKDANNATVTANFSLTVNAAVTATQSIATATLTAGHAATAFTPVTGAGGTAPLHYAVAPALPGGLTMASASGAISGTPAAASAATTYTVTVTDANGAAATATFSLTVSGSVTATVAVASTVLTQNHLATPFTPVTGTGGTAPLTYSVAPALPAGLTMASASGAISGTPTVTLAATNFTVTVTDANSATATAQFNLTVSGALTATTAVSTTTLLAKQAATPFTPVTGAGGTTPLSYSVAPALPAGLTMASATGTISGTPSVTSNATTYTVTVTDANSATATATFSLTVNSAGITINWANPAAITYGTSLAGVLNATVTYQGTAVPGTFVYTATPTAGTVTAATVLAAGNYTLTANFTPTDTTKYSTPPAASVPLTVNMAQPTIAWTPTATIAYGTSLNGLLNATVSFGGNAVAGSVAYTATAAGGAAVPVTNATVLANGNYTLTATFTPTDTTNYKTATATAPLTVTGQTLTVSANNATKVYGTANPTFTGSVTGEVNGDTFTESFTTTATTTSNAGTYAIVPSVTGANLSNYTVVTNDGTLTVTQAGTSIALTANSSSINPGSSVTLTAAVASATTGTPTGTVTFYDGSTALGTGVLAAGAGGDVATLATTSLGSGSHTITAVYGGDTNFTASSTTSSVGITVAPLGLTLSANPTARAGKSGDTFTYALSVAPAFAGTAYPGTVTFSAKGGPAGAVIFFSPTTLAANAGPQTVNMSIATSLNSAAVHSNSTGRPLVPVALAFLLLPLAGTRRMRRNGQRFARFLCLLVLALAGVAATTALTGCGSSTGGSTNTGNGTQYTVTVTATSGSVSQNTDVTLTIQ